MGAFQDKIIGLAYIIGGLVERRRLLNKGGTSTCILNGDVKRGNVVLHKEQVNHKNDK